MKKNLPARLAIVMPCCNEEEMRGETNGRLFSFAWNGLTSLSVKPLYLVTLHIIYFPGSIQLLCVGLKYVWKVYKEVGQRPCFIEEHLK